MFRARVPCRGTVLRAAEHLSVVSADSGAREGDPAMTTPIELEYEMLLALRNADGAEIRSVERISYTVALLSALSWISAMALLAWF